MWVVCPGFYLEMHTVIWLWCSGILPCYNWCWFCFFKGGFNQPAIVLCKAARWMRFWAYNAEEVCLSSKVTHGQNQQPVPGRKVSRADLGQDENWWFWFLSCSGDFLTGLFSSSFLNYFFLWKYTSLPKITGAWKHMLIFRSYSDVKIVQYRATLR